jgi:tetratricopeptide (TPR) repeat protein
MRIALLLSVTLALAASGCAQGDADGWRARLAKQGAAATGSEAYEQGKVHLLNGRYGLAVGSLRAALRSQPASPEVLNALAISYDQLGRKDLAHMYFAQALALDPGSVQTLNNVARSLMEGGTPELAAAYLQRAAQAEPQNIVVRSNIEVLKQAPAVKAPLPLLPREHERQPWIERTAPRLQTLVTQPVETVTEDDQLLPLVSFVQVAAVQEAATPRHDAVVSETLPEFHPDEALVPSAPAILAIVNGNGRTGMAARLGTYLQGQGWSSARLRNADHFDYPTTSIAYRVGFQRQARDLASALPVAVTLSERTDVDTDLELRIGRDLLAFDRPR